MMPFRKAFSGTSITKTLLDKKSWSTIAQSKGKFSIKTSGRFEIVSIYMNGTATIQIRAGLTEWRDICCTILYKEILI